MRWLAIGLLSLLTACAQPARTAQMIHHPTEAQLAEVPDAVRGGLVLATVEGGQATDPLWTSEVGNIEFRDALAATLHEFGLESFDADAPYSLSANLIGMDQPLAGFDMTVTCTADYRVEERASGNAVFDETVTTSYTAEFGDEFLAVERLRLANEGAARSNIEEFIRRFLEAAAAF